MKIFARIRAIYALLIMALVLAVCILLCYLVKQKNSHLRNKSARLILALWGAKIKQVGKPNLDAMMVIANHQSLTDILVIESIYPKDLCWVAKKELFDMPFFGHILKAPEMISIDREDKKGLIKLLQEAKDRLDKGRVLAIFPEGTRSSKDKLLPFKPGAKVIADKYSLVVQPIVLVGCRKIFDSKNLTHNFGTIKVIYLDPIVAKSEENWLEELREKMQKELDHELANNSGHR